MLDNMIADGDIEPLIVVTPTFYVEDDCADDLDQLTYSFAKELRNDLMTEIESSYSTYAKSADDKGFAESRDHRAFAGLSRGAVTMYHSALCQSLDYFSWFGAFSGSRTDKTAFEDTIQTGDFAELPIHYLYVASGNFDFALPGQVLDYQALLDIEPRLRSGVNTCFDVFPMRYHSMGNWHLALYNFYRRFSRAFFKHALVGSALLRTGEQQCAFCTVGACFLAGCVWNSAACFLFGRIKLRSSIRL